MTISSENRKAGPYTGTGSTAAYPFSFKVFTTADVLVVRTTPEGLESTLVLGADYTVTLNPDQNSNPGGTVTLSANLATGYLLTLTSQVAATQNTDITNAGGFFPAVVNNALDKLTILVQQLTEKVGRTLKVAVSTPAGVDVTLPVPSADKLIGWDSTGTALANRSPSDLATVVAFAAWQSQYFSGNGSNKQFVLSSDPGNASNLDVTIAGFGKGTLDFTLNGTTLTFTTAPAAGTNNIYVRWGQALPQSAADGGATSFLETGTSAVSRSVQERLRDLVPGVKAWSVVGDGATDDTARLSAAVNSGNTSILIDCTCYVNGALTVPAGVALHFGARGFIVVGPSANVTVNGLVHSDHQPFKYTPGSGTLTLAAKTFAVPSQYATIQRAVDAVPGRYWQDITIALADGTYAEDVRIEGKSSGGVKPGSSNTSAARAQLTVTSASNTARNAAVKVKSFMVVNCHGGAYSPCIANLTVNGYNAYTNEHEAIAFYGCSGGAVSKVAFDGTGADKCVMSFGAKVTVEGLHFGTGVNNYGLVTKHGGEIYAPDVNALNGELDLEGSLINSVTWAISGFINAANISKATAAGFNEYDTSGLRSGLGYYAMEKALAGPVMFHEYLAPWQTYFQSTTEFDTFVDAGATLAYVTNEGINVIVPNAKTSSLWVRRNRSIQLDQKKLAPMQMIVSAYVTSVTGDGVLKIGNKGSAAEDGVYFKLTTAGLFGAYQSGAGAEVLTAQLCTYAQAAGKSLVLYLHVQFDGSVIFKALDSSFNQYKKSLASGTASTGTSTYAFHALAQSAAVGTVDVYLSEARVARV